jgi:hypothetical protein
MKTACVLVGAALSVGLIWMPRAAVIPAFDELSVEQLLEAVHAAQASGTEAWHGYRFRREVVKEWLGEAGETRKRESRVLLLTPEPDGGFRELLISLDGREPPADAVARHLRARRFTQSYREMRAPPGGRAAPRGFSLDQVLRLSSPRLAGMETIDGVECRRIDFQAEPAGRKGGRMADEIRRAMEGSLWVTRDGSHVVRARARTVRPVPVLWNIARVRTLEVAVDQTEVEPGIWLPRRAVVDLDRRIVFSSGRRRTTILYSDYERVE